MKKILRSLLVSMLILSMISIMAGCTDDTDSTGDGSAAGSSSSDGVTLPEAIKNVVKINVPELDITVWTLAGGMVDGVEMEQEDLDTVLANFGGNMIFAFNPNNAVTLSNGENALESTYTVKDKVLSMSFNEYNYQAVFSDIQGQTVMIVVNKTEPNSALYFIMLDEH